MRPAALRLVPRERAPSLCSMAEEAAYGTCLQQRPRDAAKRPLCAAPPKPILERMCRLAGSPNHFSIAPVVTRRRLGLQLISLISPYLSDPLGDPGRARTCDLPLRRRQVAGSSPAG